MLARLPSWQHAAPIHPESLDWMLMFGRSLVGPGLVLVKDANVAQPALRGEPSLVSALDPVEQPTIVPNEGMRVVVRHPNAMARIPGLVIPDELEEMRVWLVPHADGTADAYAEGLVVPATACADVTTQLGVGTAKINGRLIKIMTSGMLNGVSFACREGLPTAHLLATQQQLQQVLAATLLMMGGTSAPTGP
jgi:hypothetical protein